MLPDLIEIIPPSHPKDLAVVLPGSKSLTYWALILAALASQPVVLRGALWSEDTQAMVRCLGLLGFEIRVVMIRRNRQTAHSWFTGKAEKSPAAARLNGRSSFL